MAPQGYVSLLRLAKAMRVAPNFLYDKRNKGYIETTLIKSGRYVAMAMACQLVKDWRRSCSPTEAARLTGSPEDSAWYYINRGIFESVRIFEKDRVMRRSLDRAREHFAARQERRKLIALAEAARVLRLSIWEALPVLHRHAKSKIDHKKLKFVRKSVEACAQAYSELLTKVRTGVLKL